MNRKMARRYTATVERKTCAVQEADLSTNWIILDYILPVPNFVSINREPASPPVWQVLPAWVNLQGDSNKGLFNCSKFCGLEAKERSLICLANGLFKEYFKSKWTSLFFECNFSCLLVTYEGILLKCLISSVRGYE